VLAGTADRALGGPDAVLETSDTASQKEGERPPGVARHCVRQSDKRANRQALARSPLARGAVQLLLALWLWPDRPPGAEAVTRRKGEIALARPERLLTSGVRSGTVIATRRR
jgi:hypothetical protein